jgi:hypothetical protein
MKNTVPNRPTNQNKHGSTGNNTGLAKVSVSCFTGTFVVNQCWFSASTFMVKIATFANHQTVNTNHKKQKVGQHHQTNRCPTFFYSYFNPKKLYFFVTFTRK